MRTTLFRSIVGAAVLLFSGCSADSNIEIIRAVSLFPTQSDYTEDFRNWIDQVNELGEGSFQIIYVGGPEAVSTFEQADAVRTGVVHMVFGPATYYLGLLPEVGALFASDLPPWETRKNGGIELMNQVHLKHLGVRYLARAGFVKVHLFTRDRPKLHPDGTPDLKDMKIRGGPVWRDFITSLGGVFINLAAPDIYTALERGVIDGVGWPIIGLEDFSWDTHLNYRIDPGVFSSDIGIILNNKKWEQLSTQARDLLQDAAVEYETNSYYHFKALTRNMDKRMRKRGMQVVTLQGKGAERYRKLAAEVVWQRIESRETQNYEMLREKFYPDNGE